MSIRDTRHAARKAEFQTTTSGKKAGRFRIDGPGRYRCRYGGTVDVVAGHIRGYPWTYINAHGKRRSVRNDGRWIDDQPSSQDIIAPAASPRATKASRGGKRYVAKQWNGAPWDIVSRVANGKYDTHASGMTGAFAKRIAQLLNADAGGGVRS